MTKLYSPTGKINVIDTGVVLGNSGRVAGDYDNRTNLDLWCDVFLTVQFNTVAPATREKVGELFVLFGDGEATEIFPNGGDGTIGNDHTPQGLLRVGTFYAVDPSTTTDEVLMIPDIRLRAYTNRFVLFNNSGQEYDATYQLDIVLHRTQP